MKQRARTMTNLNYEAGDPVSLAFATLWTLVLAVSRIRNERGSSRVIPRYGLITYLLSCASLREQAHPVVALVFRYTYILSSREAT